MNEKYYFSPFLSIFEYDGKYVLQTGILFQMDLHTDNADKLVERIKRNDCFDMDELLSFFSNEELVSLFQHNLILDAPLDMESRYSRNEGYFMVSKNRHAKLLPEKRILVLGAGAVGTHVAWMLSTLGVGRLTILDFDIIEESNLNRQMFFEYDEIGNSKVESLKNHLEKINPDLNVDVITDKIESEEQLYGYMSEGYDFVVRAIDSPIQAVLWINRCCVNLKIPYISGGFLEYFGIVGPTYVPGQTPCFDCYPETRELRFTREYGTIPTLSALTEFVASKMVFEMLRVLDQKPCLYNGQIEVFDSTTNESRMEAYEKKDHCDVCHSSWKKDTTSGDHFIWNVVYFILAGACAFIGSQPHWPMYRTFLFMAGIQLLLQFGRTERDRFQTAFVGGSVYVVTNLALTFRIHPELLLGSDVFMFNVATIALQIVVMFSEAIIIFMFVNYGFHVVRTIVDRVWQQIHKK